MTKPGIATTEFWVHNVLQVVTLVTGMIQVVKPEAALWIATTLAGLYIIARAIAKFGDAMAGTGIDGATLDKLYASDAAKAGTTSSGGSITIGTLVLLCGLFLFPAMVGLSGCAQNETNRAAQGLIGVQTHASNFDDLINADLIRDAATAHEGQRIIHDEQTAADAYYAAIRESDSDALAKAKAALATAKQDFLDYLAKYHLSLPQTTPIVLPTLPTTPPATRP